MQRTEQHDVHEFFSILMDALGSESLRVNKLLSDIFTGLNYGYNRSLFLYMHCIYALLQIGLYVAAATTVRQIQHHL